MATESTQAALHGAEAAAPGMPQIDPSHFPNQIFWLLVMLVIIYHVLSRVALPRIGSVLAERKGTITNDLAAAEEFKLKAVEAEAAYEQALAEARAESVRIVADTKAGIQAELDAALAKANAEIAARAAESERRIGDIRASALDAVGTVARDTAGEIVAALGLKADPALIDSAVADRMKG